MFFSAFRSLFVKELRQTTRDKRMMGILVVAPLIQLTVLGFAVNLDVDEVPTLLVDEDRTRESRALLDGLTASSTFTRIGHEGTASAAMTLIERGRVPVAVVVPWGYAENLARGEPAAVQVLVDGGDSNRAIVAQNAVVNYVLGEALRLSGRRLAERAVSSGPVPRTGTTRVEPRILYNPTMNSQIYFVPGVAATLLLVVILIVTAMGLAREKEMGTLEQVLVTPITSATLILGKTVPYAVIGLLDLGLVIAGGAFIFDVPIRGSLLLVFTGGFLYLVGVLGLGLLVSTSSRNQQQALIGAFFVFQPAILLSGFMTPVENMPAWLQPITLVNPVRHFVEVMRAVLLKDAQWSDLLPQLLALGGIGVSIFTLAVLTLRKRIA